MQNGRKNTFLRHKGLITSSGAASRAKL